jgi:protease IV
VGAPAGHAGPHLRRVHRQGRAGPQPAARQRARRGPRPRLERRDAHRLGLVDELGGLDLALLRAREAAGLAPDAPFRLRVFPRERTLLEMVLDRSREGDSSYPVSALAPLARTLETLRPLLLLARQAGLLGDPGLLTMPPMRTEW